MNDNVRHITFCLVDSYKSIVINSDGHSAILSTESRALILLSFSDAANISWHRQFIEEGSLKTWEN